MQLHAAETLFLEVGPGRTGDGPFDAMVRLKVALVGAGLTFQPDDPGADWEDAAVVRGRRLRANWR